MNDKEHEGQTMADMLAKLAAVEAYNRGYEAGCRDRNAKVVAYLRAHQEHADLMTIAKLADLIEGQLPKV